MKTIFNIASRYSDYKKITIDNLVIEMTNCYVGGANSFNFTYSYDNNTGIITIDSGQVGIEYLVRTINVYIII